MAAFINTNTASLNSQRNLSASQSSLTTSLQRLSSGLRINSAKDDAAGLAISERMTSQIRGNDQAARNANDGISLAQTAEGDLAQIGSNLQRIRELAVQSSNASNSASDRASLNNEATSLIAEIDRVASSSSFNGNKLLDGSFSAQSFQVGANNTSNDRIAIDAISSAKASSLGVGSGSSYTTALGAGTPVSTTALNAGDLAINGYSIGATTSDGVSFANGAASGIAKAAAINAVTAQTGVTATVGSASVTGSSAASGFTATVAGDVKINGVDIGVIAAGTGAVDRGTQTAAAINAKTAQTGVTATADTAGVVSLKAADGRNVTVTTTVNGAQKTGLNATTATSVTTAAATTPTVATAAGDIKINGVDIGAVAVGTDASTKGALVIAAINAKTAETGVTATHTAGAITLTAADGRAIDVTANTSGTATTGLVNATNAGNGTRTGTSSVTLSSSGSAGITLGGNAGLTATGQAVGYTAAKATAGAGVSSLDLTTAAGAQAALTTLDSALANVNNSRASLGAYQNRFSSVVTSLQTTSENLSASRSRIQDTDFAKETASLTRGQILQQAGTAMLAQANSLPNGVLALLRG